KFRGEGKSVGGVRSRSRSLRRPQEAPLRQRRRKRRTAAAVDCAAVISCGLQERLQFLDRLDRPGLRFRGQFGPGFAAVSGDRAQEIGGGGILGDAAALVEQDGGG